MNTNKASSHQGTDAMHSQSEPCPAGATSPISSGDDEPINILLVDDEPKNLTVLETVLTDPAYRLVRAESADQALLALVAEEFASSSSTFRCRA